MKIYPLTDQVRKAFKEHGGGQNSDELEAALQALLIPQPDKPKEDDKPVTMPVIEPSLEKQMYDKMYPSLKNKKRV